MRTTIRRHVLALIVVGGCTDVYDFNSTSAGDPDVSDEAVNGSTPTRFVRKIYADIVGRTPETYDVSLRFQGNELFRFVADEEAAIRRRDERAAPAALAFRMWRATIVVICMSASLAHAQAIVVGAGLGLRDVDDVNLREGGVGMATASFELAVGGTVAESTVLMARVATTMIPIEPFVTSTLFGPHAQHWIAEDVFVSATVGGAAFVAYDPCTETDAHFGCGYGLQVGGLVGATQLTIDWSGHYFGHPHGMDAIPTKTWGASVLFGYQWR